MKIRVESFIRVNGERVRFSDLTPEQREIAATTLKLTYLNELYRGKAEFFIKET